MLSPLPLVFFLVFFFGTGKFLKFAPSELVLGVLARKPRHPLPRACYLFGCLPSKPTWRGLQNAPDQSAEMIQSLPCLFLFNLPASSSLACCTCNLLSWVLGASESCSRPLSDEYLSVCLVCSAYSVLLESGAPLIVEHLIAPHLVTLIFIAFLTFHQLL